MFTTLMAWLKPCFDWFGWLFGEIWRQSCSFLWSVWSVVLVVVAIVTSFFDFLQSLVALVVDMVDKLVLPTFDLSCGDARYYLELLNTFLPVSEFFAFTIAFVSLLGLLLLYKGTKSLKSWIWGG